MNGVEAKLMAKALVRGGEWEPALMNDNNVLQREIVTRRSLWRRCCGQRLWIVSSEMMSAKGMTAPPTSRFRRTTSRKARFECAECGYRRKIDPW